MLTVTIALQEMTIVKPTKHFQTYWTISCFTSVTCVNIALNKWSTTVSMFVSKVWCKSWSYLPKIIHQIGQSKYHNKDHLLLSILPLYSASFTAIVLKWWHNHIVKSRYIVLGIKHYFGQSILKSSIMFTLHNSRGIIFPSTTPLFPPIYYHLPYHHHYHHILTINLTTRIYHESRSFVTAVLKTICGILGSLHVCSIHGNPIL